MQVGLKLTAKAGFNIARAPDVWDDFAHAHPGGGKALAVLSTHPAHGSRKEALLKEIANMKRAGWWHGCMDDRKLESSAPTKGYLAL